MTESTAIFRLEQVTKRYESVAALDGVSFAVCGNEYISLLGPSGSGKTSLLRVIAGFEKPDAGRVYFEGRDVTDLQAHKRGIGFVFQNFALFPHMSVLDNVAFGLLNGESPISRAVAHERSRAMIAMVDLAGLEGRGVDQISGGQKQRVALARTLVMEPRLVLLDEPLGALDANLRARMRTELRTIRERLGVTFLHVTGSETEALAMGDRLIVLEAGRLLQFAPPDEVYAAPATTSVARFVNRYNLFDGRLQGDRFTGPFGEAPVGRVQPSDKPLYCIRYDRLRVDPADTPAADGPALPVTFVTSEYLGSSVTYLFKAEDGKVVEVEHHMSLGAPKTYQRGAPYMLRWRPEDAIVFG